MLLLYSMQTNKKIFVGAGVVALAAVAFLWGMWSSKGIDAATTQVTLGVTAGEFSVEAPDAIDLGSVGASSVTQTKTVDLDNTPAYFKANDFKADPAGWYTTLEATTLTGTNGGAFAGTIPAVNVFIYTFSDGATLETGVANPAVVSAIPKTVYTNLGGGAVTYLKRDAGPTSGAWNVYVQSPRIRVDVPGGTPIADYQGTLEFIGIEN